MRAFLVQVKEGTRVLFSFGAMGVDSFTVCEQHADLAEDGQYVRVTAVKQEPFPVLAERNALEAARLRDVQHTDAWHRRNDARAKELQLNASGVR